MTNPPPEWSSEPNQFPSQQPPFSPPPGGFSTNPQYPGSAPPGQPGTGPPGPPAGYGQPPYGGQPPPGYAQPPYGGPPGPFAGPNPNWGAPQPPSPPNRNGLVIGGAIAAVLLVALGVGGVVFLVSGGGPDDPDPPVTLPSPSAPPTRSGEPSPEDPGPQPGSGGYAYVEDFCDQLDYQPVFDVLAYDTGPDVSESEFSSSQEQQCRYELTDGSSFGNSSVTARVHADPEQARSAFASLEATTGSFNEEREDADGWWEAGYFYYDTRIDSSVELLIRDGNLVLSARLFIAGDARNQQGQADAVVALADHARDILRSG